MNNQDPNYDYFHGSDPDIAKWEPKRDGDQFQMEDGNWIESFAPRFYSDISYRRRKPSQVEKPEHITGRADAEDYEKAATYWKEEAMQLQRRLDGLSPRKEALTPIYAQPKGGEEPCAHKTHQPHVTPSAVNVGNVSASNPAPAHVPSVAGGGQETKPCPECGFACEVTRTSCPWCKNGQVSDTPTPRTDAIYNQLLRTVGIHEDGRQFSDFARTLERELTAVIAQLEKSKQSRLDAGDRIISEADLRDQWQRQAFDLQAKVKNLERELTTAKVERDNMEQAWSEIFETRRINGMSYHEAAKAIIAERDQLKSELKQTQQALSNCEFVRLEQNKESLTELEQLKLIGPVSGLSIVDVLRELEHVKAERDETLHKLVESCKETQKWQIKYEDENSELSNERDSLRAEVRKTTKERDALSELNQTIAHQRGKHLAALEKCQAERDELQKKVEHLNGLFGN